VSSERKEGMGRKTGATKRSALSKCVSRKMPIIMREKKCEDKKCQKQAVAIAYDICRQRGKH